jgi:hypothetical protein
MDSEIAMARVSGFQGPAPLAVFKDICVKKDIYGATRPLAGILQSNDRKVTSDGDDAPACLMASMEKGHLCTDRRIK